MNTLKCRVCLEQAFKIINIFNEMESLSDNAYKSYNLADLIEQHLGFRPLPNDALSTIICKLCHEKLNGFHEFYKRVNEVQKCYLNMALPEVEITFDEIKAEPLVEFNWGTEDFIASTTSSLRYSKINRAIAISNPLLMADDENDTEKGHKANATIAIKTEPMMICDDLIGNTVRNETHDMISVIGPKPRNFEENKEVAWGKNNNNDSNEDADVDHYEDRDCNVDEDSTERVTVTRCGKHFKEPNLLKRPRKMVTNTERSKVSKVGGNSKVAKIKKEKSSKKAQQKKRVLCNAYSINDDELIRKHIPFNCGDCGHNVKNFNELKEHFIEEHQKIERPYIRCCGRKFSRPKFLVQHAYRHENPEHFKCPECQKIFVNDYALQAHMRGTHPREEDLKYNCDNCEKRFGRRRLLEMHKASHVLKHERRFFCAECPERKAYATNHLLQIHISMIHKRAKNICHVCAKEIRDKDCFRKHVLSHMGEIGPRIQCPRPNCDSWLKDEDNLKWHMERHNDEGKIFECKDCGKRCHNSKALRSHRNYAHSKTVFTCEECSKTFKRALSLKEHMAKHTGEILYKCPFCERTFNSNANMHSHKKKMHPVEWKLLRQSKMGNTQPQQQTTVTTKHQPVFNLQRSTTGSKFKDTTTTTTDPLKSI